MSSQRFDAVARRLGSASSRREVLAGLTGGVLAALGFGRAPTIAAPPSTVTICHWDADRGAYDQLTISERGLTGHQRHAEDILAPDFTSAGTCGDCNTTCAAGESCIDGACTSVCSAATCPDPCECRSSLNGTFCFSNRFPFESCRSDADCSVAGSSCQEIDERGVGRCQEIDCRNDFSICPSGSQCTSGVLCRELCTAG